VRVISLYIHIPFCARKCPYCDFYSVESETAREAFLDALGEEIELRGRVFGRNVVDTIYFGGGTPSLLKPEWVEDILQRIGSRFNVSPAAEITLEANPGTLESQSLAGYHRAGANRLSIGVQSLEDAHLRFLGRIHDSVEARASVLAARDAGFGNVSIDLIYAIPGHTMASWQATLDEAIRMRPDHISAYSLIVEDGTPLRRLVESGAVTPRSSEEEALFYEHTMEMLEAAGYEHYEVSNYSRPGYRSRHNSAYWNHCNYVGFGPSAHSFWREPGSPSARRWWNAPDLSAYTSLLKHGMPPPGEEEELGMRELINERIFLGLRSTGVDVRRLTTDLGPQVSGEVMGTIDSLVRDGYGVMENEAFRLTRRGFLICDEIAARLMIP
jgi:oxygen-independent coproporphyrinogen III oxidase